MLSTKIEPLVLNQVLKDKIRVKICKTFWHIRNGDFRDGQIVNSIKVKFR